MLIAGTDKTTTDRAGVCASTLCAVHCAAGAVLASAVGVGYAGGLVSDERVEAVLAVIAVALALVALTQGFRTHGARAPVALGAVGLTLLASSRLLEFGSWIEPGLSIGGAFLLVGAHLVNLRARRQYSACCATGTRSAA